MENDFGSETGVETSEVTQDINTGVEGNDSNSGHNPAWNGLLEALPSSLHPVVTPHLQKWDSGVQKRFEQVQSQYAPYKPFVEQKVAPEQLQAAYAVYNLMNSNPRAVYDKMVEHYGAEWGISGQGPANNDADDYSIDEGEENSSGFDENNPYYKQLKEQQDTIANFLSAQVEQQTRAQAEAEVDAEISKVKEAYGELSKRDEKIVLSLAIQGQQSLMDAAQEYFGEPGKRQQQQQSNGQQMPRIVSPTGGIPMESIDPAGLSSRETQGLIAQFLRNANNPNNN